MRRPVFLSVLLWASVLLLAGWLAFTLLPVREAPTVSFRPASFNDLPGWQGDNQALALAAFRKSCSVFSRLPPSRPLASSAPAGKVADWRGLCEAAEKVAPGDDSAARRYFETYFTPWGIYAGNGPVGKFTGYYEPVIEGSLVADPAYPVPLYKRPPELVTVDLGQFRPNLNGTHIAGRVSGGRLAPFEDRAEIEAGALSGRALELLWLKDPVDAFNLHVQGSGRVRLADGRLIKVGYAGPNGHPYTSLGRLLVERGEMVLEDVSAPAIWHWLRTHPAESTKLMQENASFVFFQIRGDAADGGNDNPIGALGVPLTPGRSLAIDRAMLPLGVPYWLVASQPNPADPTGAALPLNRLLVAQDTGGAIRGAVRGDVFWGRGETAGVVAGHMNAAGRIFILLPKDAAEFTEAGN